MVAKHTQFSGILGKRAVASKARAKARHFASDDECIVEPETRESDMVGHVVSVAESTCTVLVDGEYRAVTFHGKNRPVVGDMVSMDSRFAVTAILPRKTFLARLRGDRSRRSHEGYSRHVIVANVEVAVIVAAAVNPEFHPRFIDRYLIVCQNGGVEPIIALSKADLTATRSPMLDYYRRLNIPVVETSSVSGEGLEELKALLRGKVAVLVGHSGVGKSSLINALIPGIGLTVNEISAQTGKGKHTTTTSHLYEWEDGSSVIDTPGIRSLGIGDLDKGGLADFFPEFGACSGGCKYRDCLHLHEPGCAVKEAVAAGEIHAGRYESYVRLLEE